MNSQELKELVKSHFSLVEASTESTPETFGEVMDVNKAFTFIFPNERLEVGDKVMVRTTEGQELVAPDGTHELENGLKIVVEGGVVREIMDATSTEETMEEVVVEVEPTEEAPAMEEPSVEEIVSAIVDVVKQEVDAMKTELAKMKEKMDAFMNEPATEKSMPTAFSKTAKLTDKPQNMLNEKRFNMAVEALKSKK